MPHFFVYLIVLCGQKFVFLIKTPIFGVHFGVHIWRSFPLIAKALRDIFPKSFFFIKLKFKLHQIHLVRHKLIREMGVNSSDKPFRTVPHPSIHNISLTYCTQVVAKVWRRKYCVTSLSCITLLNMRFKVSSAQLQSIGSLMLIYFRACLGIGIFLYTLSPSDVLCFAFKAIKKSPTFTHVSAKVSVKPNETARK